SARSNGRRTHSGECRRAPSATAAASPVQGLRQVVRPGGRRVRPLHVQTSPQGQALRDLRIPRMRRAGRARATGEVMEGTRIRRLEERDIEAALAPLRATGVRTVRLNAYFNAIPFYERLGFQREYEVIRWHGPATPGERVRGIRPIRAEDLTDLAQMDAKYFGANRHVLLAR